MSPGPVGISDMPLDDPVYNLPIDVPCSTSPSHSPGGSDQEGTDNKAALFNLDNNRDFIHPTLPWATLGSLASTQRIVELIQAASFSDKEKQWSVDEFDLFLHPPHEQFCLDDPQLHLSLKVYISLSAHSSEVTYNAVHRGIKECYPDSTMLSFDQV